MSIRKWSAGLLAGAASLALITSADAQQKPQYGGTIEVATMFATLSALSWDPYDWNWKLNHDTSPFYEQLIAGDLDKSVKKGGKYKFIIDAFRDSTARSTRPQTAANVAPISAGMSAKESKWAREANQTEPGRPVWPGLCRVQCWSDQIRLLSESALQGKQASPPSSPRRGGSGTTGAAGSITVRGSAYGSVMVRACARRRRRA